MSAAKIGPETGFYVAGGTLGRDAPCYMARRADAELYDGLRQGQFCYVLTARQMGKSSLMVRTAVRLREAGAGAAVLDLTATGQNLSAEQWYRGLLSQAGQSLELEDELVEFWRNLPELGPMQRWMRALVEVVLPRYHGPVVIFVDEIDAVRCLPFSTDEFFAAIRESYNRRAEDTVLQQLTFCLLGVATPSDLIRDTRTTPFNIGRRIELHDFTAAEAAPLARGLRRTEGIGAELLKRVLYWTGGHPYLTQRLCQAVADDAGMCDGAGVDRRCAELFLSPRARERDDNLLFVRERMLRSEVDLAGLLGLYARVRRGRPVRDDETSPLASVLRLSGIVRVENGYLRERNRIYARVFDRGWVQANMPGAELRRQREAFRRGLLRASAVALVVVLVMAALVLMVIGQRDRAERQELANRRLLYNADMNLVHQAWLTSNTGRMRELLMRYLPEPGREDPRGFEWYYLWRLCHSDRFTFKHEGTVLSVAFSPDGGTLTTADNNGFVRLWDLATGEQLKALEVGASSVSISPDGKMLAVGGIGPAVQIWDAATWRQRTELKGHTSRVVTTAFSPDGKRLATGSKDHTLRIWDVASGEEKIILKEETGNVASVAFSPDGRRLAAGGEGVLTLWDAAEGRKLKDFEGYSGRYPHSVAFSPDGQAFAAPIRGGVRLWAPATGRELITIGRDATSIAFSPDGKIIATAGFNSIAELWEVATGRPLASFKGHSNLASIAFSPDGRWLVTGSNDKTARLWEVGAKLGPSRFIGHAKAVYSLAFSPDGTLLATGSDDQTAKLWKVTSGEEALTFRGHTGRVFPVAFSPDGKRIATGSDDRTGKLWDVATGQSLATLAGHSGPVWAIKFSPVGREVATGGEDGCVRLWDAATGQALTTFTEGVGEIFAVAFSPDGKRLIGGAEKVVKLWDVGTGQNLVSYTGEIDLIYSLALSPDGRKLATGSRDGLVRLWDAATGRLLATLNGHGGEVWSVAFSPDGKRLASGGNDHTVKLWNVDWQQEVITLGGYGGMIYSLAFSPDGRILAAAGGDGTVSLSRAATTQEVLARLKK